jgi:hypothetical protein
MVEIRIAKSVQNLKMERSDAYLREIKKLLAMMKVERAYIPPAWLPRKDVEELVRRAKLQVKPIS